MNWCDKLKRSRSRPAVVGIRPPRQNGPQLCRRYAHLHADGTALWVYQLTLPGGDLWEIAISRQSCAYSWSASNGADACSGELGDLTATRDTAIAAALDSVLARQASGTDSALRQDRVPQT